MFHARTRTSIQRSLERPDGTTYYRVQVAQHTRPGRAGYGIKKVGNIVSGVPSDTDCDDRRLFFGRMLEVHPWSEGAIMSATK